MSAPSGRLHPRTRIELGDYPVDAAWSGDGRSVLVAGGEGALLRVVDASASSVQPIGRHEGGVLGVACQKAGRLFASSGQDGTVRLWDLRDLSSKTIHRSAEWSERLAFSDNGRWLAVSTGRALQVFDEDGMLRHRLSGHPGAIAALAWRPKLNEIAATGNNGARLHRLEPAPQSREFAAGGACLTANWSPDGRLLAAGMQDGSICLWNVITGTQSQITGLGSRVFATEWSSNGNFLAAAAGSALATWDARGKSPQGWQATELQAHSERLTALRFRPNGSYLVSAARDRRLLLWRIGQSEEPQDAHLLPDECTLLRFSRDGALLAVGDALGGLTIYEAGNP
jgi:WD40 repeat protein